MFINIYLPVPIWNNLLFSLYLMHGFCSESEDVEGNRVNESVKVMKFETPELINSKYSAGKCPPAGLRMGYLASFVHT